MRDGWQRECQPNQRRESHTLLVPANDSARKFFAAFTLVKQLTGKNRRELRTGNREGILAETGIVVMASHRHRGTARKTVRFKISPHATDADDVVVYSFADDDVLELKRVWREEGILPRGKPSKTGATAKIADKPKRDAADEADAAKRCEVTQWLWGKSEPAGSVVKAYFRSRGIEIETWPQVIRFLPASPPKHPYPAMVAPFGLPDEPEPGAFTSCRASAFKGCISPI